MNIGVPTHFAERTVSLPSFIVRVSYLSAALASAMTLAACSDASTVPTRARSAARNAVAAKSSPAAARTVAVTSVIADDDQSLAPSLQIRSDGYGPYTNSSDLQSLVQASTTGDWVLDSSTPTNGTRQIYLDFSRPIANSGPNQGDAVAIPSAYYRFHMISKCHLTGYDFLTIPAGTTVQCPLHIGQIYVNGQEYGITMNAGTTSSGETWPETQYANVRCNSATGSTCTSWTITPSGTANDGSAANVAVLLQTVTSTSKGKPTTTVVKQGDFYMSFRIDISNP